MGGSPPRQVSETVTFTISELDLESAGDTPPGMYTGGFQRDLVEEGKPLDVGITIPSHGLGLRVEDKRRQVEHQCSSLFAS